MVLITSAPVTTHNVLLISMIVLSEGEKVRGETLYIFKVDAVKRACLSVLQLFLGRQQVLRGGHKEGRTIRAAEGTTTRAADGHFDHTIDLARW
jgi:hypothetical protein